MNTKDFKAFTLVELIVVITILAILGTIAFISLQGFSSDARDSTRISDTSTMKKSLELYYVSNGEYPDPDDSASVNYNTETLWNQGSFGDDVISGVWKNLSEAPLDPLTNEEYTYSLSNTKTEYEILELLESDDLVMNNILVPTVNAANTKVYSKISGNYNGVYLKTENYVVPVPSLINAEVENTSMILDDNNIKSMIVSGEDNVLKVGDVIEQTGKLDIKLSVFSGSISDNNTDTEKEEIITAIQSAYAGSSIENNSNISSFVSATDEDKIDLFDTIISGKLSSANLTSSNTTNSCEFNGNTYAHGESITAFNNKTIDWNSTEECLSEVKQCNNGVISFSDGYEFSSCKKGTANNCSENTNYDYFGKIYSINALSHGDNGTYTISENENNGIYDYTLNLQCNDGSYINESETGPVIVSCDEGYIKDGLTCRRPVSCDEYKTSNNYTGEWGYLTIKPEGSAEYQTYCDSLSQIGLDNYLENGDFTDGLGVPTEDGSNNSNTIVSKENPTGSNYSLYQSGPSSSEYEVHFKSSDFSKIIIGDYIVMEVWVDKDIKPFHSRIYYTDGTSNSISPSQGYTIETTEIGGVIWYKQRNYLKVEKEPTSYNWYLGYGEGTDVNMNVSGLTLKIMNTESR